MNNMKKGFLILLLLVGTPIRAGFFWPKLPDEETARTFIIPDVNEKEEQQNRLIKELEEFQQQEQEQIKQFAQAIDKVNGEQQEVSAKLKSATPLIQEFLNKKSAKLNELENVLVTLQLSPQQLILIVDKQVKLLKEYLRDPDFTSLTVEPQAFYSMEDLRNASKKVINQEEVIKYLQEQKKDAAAEGDNRKRQLINATKQYNNIIKKQEEFATKTVVPDQSYESGLTFKQSGQLIDLEREYADWQVQLAKIQEMTAQYELAFIETSIFTEQEKLKKLKLNYAKVREGLRVDELSVAKAKEKLNKFQQDSLAQQAEHNNQIKRLTKAKDILRKELEDLGKQYSVSTADLRALTEWNFDAHDAQAFLAQCEIGKTNQEIILIDTQIEYLKANIERVKKGYRREERNVDIMDSWYKITQRKFENNEQLVFEIKSYKDFYTEAQSDIDLFKDKQAAAMLALNIHNKSLANIRSRKQELEKRRDELFRLQQQKYSVCTQAVAEVDQLAVEQIEFINKIIEEYTQIISLLRGVAEDMHGIISELETKSMWQRSEAAITWQGFVNIIPDLSSFVRDTYSIGASYIATMSWRSVFNRLQGIFTDLSSLILIILNIIFFIVVLLLIRYRLPRFKTYVLSSFPESGIWYRIAHITAAFGEFVETNMIGLYIWFISFWLVYFELVPEVFPRTLFYVGSIGYFVYLTPRFAFHMISFNRYHHYALFAEIFERRFTLVFLLFGYLSSIILLFREAFILVSIHKSELPTILLALYSIVLRILIILSIGKEEVLGIIPERGRIWQYIASMIKRYYYPILFLIIFIMVLSDPWIGGFKNLVDYFVWGIGGTVLLVWVLYVLQVYLKQLSSQLFFYTDDETTKERFGNAKTWYGLFTIISFMLIGMLGVYLALYFWNIPLPFETFDEMIHYKLFRVGYDSIKTEYVYFTPSTLLVVIACILTGFLLASAFTKFVLRRIFDLLLIDLGIQNAVISITRYVIIMLSILIGFLWADLASVLIGIGVVFAAIIYYVKEPVGDFISYFVILVQRPIEIGDYIMIDDSTQGVVRQITPRSVILRRKDSYTIIVPNSMFVSHPVHNWNYARNFVALDDIIFTVGYSAQPEIVKEVVAHVLDNSINILKSPRPIIRLAAFSIDGFEFMIRCFVTSQNILKKWDIASDVRLELTRALREAGIRLAVPRRVVMSVPAEKEDEPL